MLDLTPNSLTLSVSCISLCLLIYWLGFIQGRKPKIPSLIKRDSLKRDSLETDSLPKNPLKPNNHLLKIGPQSAQAVSQLLKNLQQVQLHHLNKAEESLQKCRLCLDLTTPRSQYFLSQYRIKPQAIDAFFKKMNIKQDLVLLEQGLAECRSMSLQGPIPPRANLLDTEGFNLVLLLQKLTQELHGFQLNPIQKTHLSSWVIYGNVFKFQQAFKELLCFFYPEALKPGPRAQDQQEIDRKQQLHIAFDHSQITIHIPCPEHFSLYPLFQTFADTPEAQYTDSIRVIKGVQASLNLIQDYKASISFERIEQESLINSTMQVANHLNCVVILAQTQLLSTQTTQSKTGRVQKRSIAAEIHPI